MKIKLILAASPDDPLRKNDPFMPLSLPLLAAAAPGHEYALVDLLWESDVRFDEPVDLVGISARHSAEPTAYAIADRFRSRGVPVVLGGPQVSAVPLEAAAHADAVAVGEGEPLWPLIVADAAAGDLRRFYVCSPEPFDAGGRPLRQVFDYPDLQNLPVPRRDLLRRRYTFDTLFASRGCPMDCDFCSVPRLFGTRLRLRPVEQVVAEIDTFRNYYYLIDDTVFGRPSTYDYYLRLYAAVAKLKKRRYWTGQANLDAAADPKGRDVIRAAAACGLLYAAVGMESVDPAVLETSGAIRKTGAKDPARVLDAMRENIRFIQEQGIVVSGWFVVGYEQDTVETFGAIGRFCREMNVLPVVFPVFALHGTRLYERMEREGRLADVGYSNIRHPSLATPAVVAAMDALKRREYSLRRNLSRTRFYRRFFRDDVIHRTIFTFVTQTKINAGLNVACEAMRGRAPIG